MKLKSKTRKHNLRKSPMHQQSPPCYTTNHSNTNTSIALWI